MSPDAKTKTETDAQSLLRELPSVDSVLATERLKDAAKGFAPALVTDLVREAIEVSRKRILGGAKNGGDSGAPVNRPDAEPLATTVIDRVVLHACLAIGNLRAPHLTRVINATGIIIHTGMGRSPIAPEALDAVSETARGYCDVDLSKDHGGRRGRSNVVEELLQRLTGCEAALVTNNNAAATLLALHTLACDREVIVSRGQLVEIGGSFRLPDVMISAGARLDEVGTTNRTRIGDYESAINENTGALMRIHPSNFRIVGFTESVEIEALVELGRKHGIKVIDDIGSGALIDLSPWGLKGEPEVRASVEAGADVVLFSGDKLLGGPQAGILLGKRESVEACAKNPLMRALRVGKMTLSALEATLRLYLEPDTLSERLPILRMIQEPAQKVKERAERVGDRLRKNAPSLKVSVEEDVAYVGGGSLPEESLPSWIVTVELSGGTSVEAAKKRLRTETPSVFARARQDRLEFDMRTVADGEVEGLAAAIVTSASIDR